MEHWVFIKEVCKELHKGENVVKDTNFKKYLLNWQTKVKKQKNQKIKITKVSSVWGEISFY